MCYTIILKIYMIALPAHVSVGLIIETGLNP